jgi:hypothetical protein
MHSEESQCVGAGENENQDKISARKCQARMCFARKCRARKYR